MATINQTAYDKLKQGWKTDMQIKSAIINKYWADSSEAKTFDWLLQSKLAVNQPIVATTQKPTITPIVATTQKPTITPVAPTIPKATSTPAEPIKSTTPIVSTTPKTTTTPVWQTQIDNALKTWSIADVRNQLKWKVTQDQFNKIDSYLVSKIPKVEMPVNNKLLSETELQKKRDIVNKAIQDKKTNATSNVNNSVFNMTADQQLETKWKELERFRNVETSKIDNDYKQFSNVLKTNNQAILWLYWVKPDWTVDFENQNWLAFQIDKRKKDFDELKNKEFSKLKSLKYQSIWWQIRAAAASRWVDLSKVPFEQIVALSDQVWQSKITEVYNAKEKMINDIQTYSDNAENQINLLREKWLVSTNEANKNIETLRQSAEAQKLTINKEYVNSMLWLAEWKLNDTETKKASTLNSITTLWTSLWLSGTSLWLLNSYIWKYKTPQEAYQAIFKDLSNTSSELYKSLKTQEQAAIAQQAFKNQLEELKATKSWSSSSFKPTENQWKMLSLLWLTSDNITDMNQYLRLQTAVMALDVEWVKNITWVAIPKKQLEDSVKFLYWWIQPISETISNQPTQSNDILTQQEMIDTLKINKAPELWTQEEINQVVEAKKKSSV